MKTEAKDMHTHFHFKIGDRLRNQFISKEDFFGIFFVRKPDRINWDSYYNTIEALRPLLDNNEFNNVVNGFYLNHIKESVRISYFVDKANSEKATSTFRDFFRENRIQEIGSEPPRKAVVAEKYGGEELEERFRNFLSLKTQIGLDLIEADLLQARILFATYSLQVRKASLSVRKHFQPIFMKHSPI